MSAIAATFRPIPFPGIDTLRRDPAAQAFMLLRVVFIVAPILFGIDKFANVLTDDWTRYLAVEFNDIIGLDRTNRNPEVEEVLGALSLLLNGGGVG